MRVHVKHAIPVRYRPGRSRSDRVALQAAITPVDIPEVPAGTLEWSPGSYSLQGVTCEFMIHGDRCFQPIEPWMLGPGKPPVGEAMATPAEVAASLSLREGRVPSFLVPGTPLHASPRVGATPAPHGEDLPASILSNAVSDLTDAVRAALVDWVARNLVTDGERVYASRGLPVIAPHSWRERNVLPQAPASLEAGPVFEPARFHLVKAYQDAIGYRGAALARVKGSTTLVQSMEAAFSRMPYVGADIALYVNAGPGTVERLFRMVSDNCARMGTDISHVRPRVDRLLPYADLGLVGAVPEASHAEVVALMGDALDAIQAALPESYQPILPRWLKGYSDAVMRPSFPVAAVPDEDVASLTALGFAP